MVNALSVANTILKKSFEENRDITPMKLQKLLYLVYKKYHDITGKALFAERFEAWRYGPVVSSVYNEFKQYKANHISDYYISSDGEAWGVDESSNDAFCQAINYVWENYSKYDGIPLSTMTHQIDSAWYNSLVHERKYIEDTDIANERWELYPPKK